MGFLLIVELSVKKWKTALGTSLMIGDVSIVIWLCIYYRIWPTIYPLYWIAFVLNTIGFIGAFWVPESPEWLVALGREEEAKKSINQVAKFNGKPELNIISFAELERKTEIEPAQGVDD